jgi:hypothetical protein
MAGLMILKPMESLSDMAHEVAQVFDPVLGEGWRVIIASPMHADHAVLGLHLNA